MRRAHTSVTRLFSFSLKTRLQFGYLICCESFDAANNESRSASKNAVRVASCQNGVNSFVICRDCCKVLANHCQIRQQHLNGLDSGFAAKFCAKSAIYLHHKAYKSSECHLKNTKIYAIHSGCTATNNSIVQKEFVLFVGCSIDLGLALW